MSMVRQKSPNVVVVGAGPVGLSFAIDFVEEAKAQNKNIELLMIERYKEYQRTQRLKLDLSLINNAVVKADLEALVEQRKAKFLDKNNIEIPIQTLENCLLATAKKMNIAIEYKKFLTREQYEAELKEQGVEARSELEKKLHQELIVDAEELSRSYPYCRLVIGADGSRSAVREFIAADEESPIVKTELRNMVELNYVAKGKVEKLPMLLYYEMLTLIHGFICTESISYVKEKNQTKVTLRFLVDDETFNDSRLKGINAKNLLPLSKDIPKKLKNAITIWLNTRKDDVIAFTPVLNKADLSMYESIKLWGKIGDGLALLIGDAARGFPFMNGLNLGIENSNQLVKLLVDNFEEIQARNKPIIKAVLDKYIQLGQEVFEKGMARVNYANKKISVGQTLSHVSFFASYPIKVSVRSVLKKDHPIFEAHAMMDLSPLIKYVQDKFDRNPRSKKYILSHNLLTKLQEGSMGIEQVIALLYSAYQKNRAIETNSRNYYVLGLNLKMVNPWRKREAHTSLEFEEKETTAHVVQDIPNKLTSGTDKQLSQGLHRIIKTLHDTVKERLYLQLDSHLNKSSAETKPINDVDLAEIVQGYLGLKV